jgi:hypothetical protein
MAQSLNDSFAQSFLQNSNLPGMVKLVLRYAMQHEVEIIFLSGNPLS